MPSHFTCCCTLFQLALTSAYAAEWLEAAGRKWQLVTAWNSLQQLPDTPPASCHQQTTGRASQHNNRDSQVCEGQDDINIYSQSGSDAKMSLSDVWTLMLRSDWYNLKSWCTLNKTFSFLLNCFSKLLSFPCSITSFTIPGMYEFFFKHHFNLTLTSNWTMIPVQEYKLHQQWTSQHLVSVPRTEYKAETKLTFWVLTAW